MPFEFSASPECKVSAAPNLPFISFPVSFIIMASFLTFFFLRNDDIESETFFRV